MIFGDRDLFESWRLVLTVACTIYAIVVTGRWLWEWAGFLSGPEPTKAALRKYVLVLLLRTRFRPMLKEFAGIAACLVALVILLRWH